MFLHYIRSKYILLIAKTISVTILFLFIYLFNSPELTHKKNIHPNIVSGNNEIVYAEFIDNEFLNDSDSSSSAENEKEKSDLFYYILGIVILVAAGFILKQRYEQYLKQRDNL